MYKKNELSCLHVRGDFLYAYKYLNSYNNHE